MINWSRQLFRGARWATKPMKKQSQPRTEFAYQFTFPNDAQPVVIRGRNQREARQHVRSALDLTRLPVGTTVERLD